MSENREPAGNAGSSEKTGEFWGRLACGLGLALAVGGVAGVFLGPGLSVTSGAVGAGLGILGYFLGANRLGTLTLVLSTTVVFFGLAAGQGLIPGVGPTDRDLPAREPRAEDN